MRTNEMPRSVAVAKASADSEANPPRLLYGLLAMWTAIVISFFYYLAKFGFGMG